MSFADFVQTECFSSEQVRRFSRHIHGALIQKSRHISDGDFESLHADDLANLFDLYDTVVFDGDLKDALADNPLRFRLSRRMTRAGAMTVRYESPRSRHRYEIVMSTTLLYQTFRDDHREVTVTGVSCRDRLEAMQRLFEHELVHLIELLLWQDSSCSKGRFQSIATRLFGHLEHSHQLITPDERAWAKQGLRVGSRVRFDRDGEVLTGVVNRITRRATVLVESKRGIRYDDGKRYAKYYVPISLLRPADQPTPKR